MDERGTFGQQMHKTLVFAGVPKNIMTSLCACPDY